MLITFSFVVSGIVGHLCCDRIRLEETPNEKVINMSKLTKSYFKTSTAQDAPSVKLRKRCSIRRFLSSGNNERKSENIKSENLQGI